MKFGVFCVLGQGPLLLERDCRMRPSRSGNGAGWREEEVTRRKEGEERK